ncbi:MAG TPA: hypothetical protein VKA10_03215 [Prolixibacteraceae bacterium]|nr:hypothetical protein [Prolixibacteraceae bacterium]
MKSFILKFSFIFLFVATWLGCEKEETWEEIQLNNNVCANTVGVDYSFTDYSAIIDTLSSKNPMYILRGTKPEFIEDVVFLPCNLPVQYNQPGLEINFSGNVLLVKDWVPGDVQSDLLGTPVTITSAKIKAEENK